MKPDPDKFYSPYLQEIAPTDKYERRLFFIEVNLRTIKRYLMFYAVVIVLSLLGLIGVSLLT